MKRFIVQKITTFMLAAALILGCCTAAPVTANAAGKSSSIAKSGLTLRKKSVKIGNYKIYIGKKAGRRKYPIYKKNLKTKKKVFAGYSVEKNYYTYKKNILVFTNNGYLYKTKLTQKKRARMKNFKKNSYMVSIYSKKYMITQKGSTLSKLNVSTGKSEVLTTKGPSVQRIFTLDGDTLYYAKHNVSKKIDAIYSLNIKNKTLHSVNLPLGYILETKNLIPYKNSIYFTVNVCKVLEDTLTTGGFGMTNDMRIMKYSAAAGLSEYLANSSVINFSGNYLYYYTGREGMTDPYPVIHQYNTLTKEDKKIVDTKNMTLYADLILKVQKNGSVLTIYTCNSESYNKTAVYTINEDGTNLCLKEHKN